MRDAATVLGIMHDRGRRGLPVEDVYRQLYNPALYVLAYGKIAGNAGALTPGATTETADEMTLAKIQRIIDLLRQETYRWTPVRRVRIPKKYGTTRPLGIPTWTDKLLQEIICLILEAYYEPHFSSRSHGFRPGRGCHTALTEIYRTWKGTAWFIEGDITGCFDNLDHEVLLGILREKIHDGRFLRLIANLLRPGYLARNLKVMLETVDRLAHAGVGFVSITENIDYSTPMGRVVLSNMGSLAQYYSDNLSYETKKGKRERKAQGLYNGLLPFGATKGRDGIPAPDSKTHPGLALAFELAAGGKADREIARALNDAGYRTSGNRGQNPFTKDTVRPMLQNRFYLGELPDGEGGWIAGKHRPLIDPALFASAQPARERNTRRPRRVGGPGQPWALSGIGVCVCGASMVANGRPSGRRSLRCAGRAQGTGCDAPSFYEDVLNEQLTSGVLAKFAVSEAEQEKLVAAWLRHQGTTGDAKSKRENVDRRIARLREVYLDGDLEPTEYRKRRATLLAEREALPVETATSEGVARQLAAFLSNIPAAWEVATPDERNRLARQLFAEALIDNRTVVAVKPRPELLPFFESVNWCVGGSDGIRTRDLSLDRAAC